MPANGLHPRRGREKIVNARNLASFPPDPKNCKSLTILWLNDLQFSGSNEKYAQIPAVANFFSASKRGAGNRQCKVSYRPLLAPLFYLNEIYMFTASPLKYNVSQMNLLNPPVRLNRTQSLSHANQIQKPHQNKTSTALRYGKLAQALIGKYPEASFTSQSKKMKLLTVSPLNQLFEAILRKQFRNFILLTETRGFLTLPVNSLVDILFLAITEWGHPNIIRYLVQSGKTNKEVLDIALNRALDYRETTIAAIAEKIRTEAASIFSPDTSQNPREKAAAAIQDSPLEALIHVLSKLLERPIRWEDPELARNLYHAANIGYKFLGEIFISTNDRRICPLAGIDFTDPLFQNMCLTAAQEGNSRFLLNTIAISFMESLPLPLMESCLRTGLRNTTGKNPHGERPGIIQALFEKFCEQSDPKRLEKLAMDAIRSDTRHLAIRWLNETAPYSAHNKALNHAVFDGRTEIVSQIFKRFSFDSDTLNWQLYIANQNNHLKIKTLILIEMKRFDDLDPEILAAHLEQSLDLCNLDTAEEMMLTNKFQHISPISLQKILIAVLILELEDSTFDRETFENERVKLFRLMTAHPNFPAVDIKGVLLKTLPGMSIPILTLLLQIDTVKEDPCYMGKLLYESLRLNDRKAFCLLLLQGTDDFLFAAFKEAQRLASSKNRKDIEFAMVEILGSDAVARGNDLFGEVLVQAVKHGAENIIKILLSNPRDISLHKLEEIFVTTIHRSDRIFSDLKHLLNKLPSKSLTNVFIAAADDNRWGIMQEICVPSCGQRTPYCDIISEEDKKRLHATIRDFQDPYLMQWVQANIFI